MFPVSAERQAIITSSNSSAISTFAPELVFFAYANPDAKRAWFTGPPEWDNTPGEMDFRIGGRETSSGGPKGEWTSLYDSRYLDIVPNERIINAFSMYIDGRADHLLAGDDRVRAKDGGTDVNLTEQIVFLDGATISKTALMARRRSSTCWMPGSRANH